MIARVEMPSPIAFFKNLHQSTVPNCSATYPLPCYQHGALTCFRTSLNQLAISRPGLRMFIGEPQKHKADNRHQYVNWKNESHVTGGEIVRDDHLVNVTAGRAQ